MAYIGKRPGTVTAAAVILFIVGGWSILAGPCSGGIISLFAAGPDKPPPPPGKAQPDDPFASVRFIFKEVPSYFAVMLGSLCVGMLFGAAQIAAGVGLLRMRPLGRWLAILASVGKLFFAYAGHAYQALVVMPAQERFFQQNPQILGGNVAGGLGFVTLIATAAIQTGIGIVIIVLICTPGANKAFAATALPPTEDDGPPPRRYEGYDDDEPRSPPDTGITDRP